MPMLMGLGGHATLQPQPSQICTRTNKGLEQVPKHEELVKMNKDSLTTVVQARENLEKEGYALLDAWGGRAKLSYMLLLLLHAVPPSILPKGIRAVTTLLELEEAAHTTDIITATVLCKIELVLDSMEKVANQAQGTVSDTRMVADQLYRTGEETRDELQKGMDAAKEDIQRAMEFLKDEVRKLNETAASATNDMGVLGSHQNDGVPRHATYADMLNRQLLEAHLST